MIDFESRNWPNSLISLNIGVALGRCSLLDEFWALADAPRTFDQQERLEIDWRRWGWPYEPPSTEEGRSLCWRVAGCLSDSESWQGAKDIDFRLRFLASALALERQSISRGRLLDEAARELGNGTTECLRAIWKSGARLAKTRKRRPWDGQMVRMVGLAANVVLLAILVSSPLTERVGLGNLGVGWPSVFSGLFVGLPPFFVLAALAMIDESSCDEDLPLWDALKLACQPAMVFGLYGHFFLAGLAGLAQRMVSRKRRSHQYVWINLSPSIASRLRIFISALAATLPIAGLWIYAVDGEGGILGAVLVILAVVNPLYLLTYSAEATPPIVASKKTLELLDKLSRDAA